MLARMQLVTATWHPGGAGPQPTVIALHGRGASALDLLGLAPYLAGGRLQVLCPEAEFAFQGGAPSYTWFQPSEGTQRSGEEFERVTGVVRQWIDDAIAQYDVDPNRVVLLGFSQGGTLAYRLGLAEPTRFRGVAALSTWLPDEAVERADRDGVAQLPVMVQHGTRDPMIEINRAQQSRDRLVEVGVTPDYHEYPMEHQITGESLADLTKWLERVLDLPPST